MAERLVDNESDDSVQLPKTSGEVMRRLAEENGLDFQIYEPISPEEGDVLMVVLAKPEVKPTEETP